MSEFVMGVWVGRFVPVPGIAPEMLDSSRYCLLTAKAVAEVLHLGGDSGKLADSRQLSTREFFAVHKRENISRA